MCVLRVVPLLLEPQAAKTMAATTPIVADTKPDGAFHRASI
jgi:hypothetical protein